MTKYIKAGNRIGKYITSIDYIKTLREM